MPNFPHVIVDLRHRTLTVALADVPVAGTHELDDAHLVDVDGDGAVVGIEILTLDDWKLDEMGERFDFQDQVPAIRAALDNVLRAPTGTTGTYADTMIIDATRVEGSSPRVETDDSSEAPEVRPIIA